jgi:D-xylose transport system permease protein
MDDPTGLGGGAGAPDQPEAAGVRDGEPVVETGLDLTAVAPEVLADSLGDYLRASARRIKNGESGTLPIIVGLIVILIFFQLERSRFDSAVNLVNLLVQASLYIMLGLAELFALILSEIDLSAGFMAGTGAFAIAELISSPVNFPWWLGIICGIGVCGAIGYLQGTIISRLHVPSFVVTLAGLLFLEGVVIELATVDKSASGGVISVDSSSPIIKLVSSNVSTGVSWVLLVVFVALFAAYSIRRAAERRAKGLSAPPLSITLLTIAASAIGGAAIVYICSRNRGTLLFKLTGVPYVVLFDGLVLFVYTVMLGRMRLGRYMYAIGNNPEAARRAGIKVQRIRRITFVFSGATAGLAGLVYLAQAGSVSTGIDGGSYTLYGVAAAVIGGASLFGGRGKPVHALLGGLVIGVVFNGLALMGINAAGQFMATAIVLLVAATVDALVRRRSGAL